MPRKTKKKMKNTRKQKPTTNRADNNRDEDDSSDTDCDDIKVEILESPIKSEKDKNEYRVLKLPNGLIAMLVARPGIDALKGDIAKGAAAACNVKSNTGVRHRCTCHDRNWFDTMMTEAQTITRKAFIYLTIGAGCFSDPRQVPGVSHLVSKSILGNSKKYPDEEDDLQHVVANCDGNDRLVSKADSTTFSIDVPEDNFLEILDRFSNCFVSPVTKRDEIHVLRHHLEKGLFITTQNGMLMDGRGKVHLFTNLASARHPAKTLGPNILNGLIGVPDDQVYKEVIKFRDRHYRAHRMTLVLKATLPLDTLEFYAKKYFSKIPNNRMQPREFTQYNFANSFDTPKSRKIYTMQPANSREIYALEFNWTLPPSHWLYRSKPRDYIASLLQHEGEGSLFSYLRKKNWSNKIIIGGNNSDFTDNSVYCLFSMKILLTQEGYSNKKKILDAVFSYVNLLRRTGPQERIFDELRKIEDAKFRFGRNFGPVDYYEDLCINMHLYPPIDYLTGRSLYLEYDDVSLKTCLDLLTPERATIIVYDKNFQKNDIDLDRIIDCFDEATTIEEEFFACLDGETNVKFHTSTDIPEDWINYWKIVEPMPNFNLPISNVFLPDDFTLIPEIKDPPRYPVKIHSDNLSEVWFKPDMRFRTPQCFMNFRYVSPLPLAEPENSAMLDLLVETLKQVTSEELYPAGVAELKHEIKACEKGFIVQAHGFNQKLPLLMKKISKYIAELPKLVTEDLFKKIIVEQKEKYLKSLRNPELLAEELMLSMIRLVHWTSLDKLTALPAIKYHNFLHFLERFVDHLYLQCLVQGNISKAAVIENSQECVKISNYRQLSANTMPQLRVHELPRGQRCCRVKSFHANSDANWVQNYYQIGEATSHRLAVMIDLLVMIMTDSKFQAFRDEETASDAYVAKKHTFGMYGYSITMINTMNRIHQNGFGLMDQICVSVPEIEDTIENYRRILNLSIKSLSEKELLGFKKILLTAKQRTDANLRTEVMRNWEEITSGDNVFNRRELEVAAINALGIEDMKKWLAHLTTDPSKLRKLSVQVCNNEEIELNAMGFKFKRDKRDDKSDSKNNHQLDLTYLTDLPKRSKKTSDYYITNIADFKNGLQVLPIVKKVATAAEPSAKSFTNAVNT